MSSKCFKPYHVFKMLKSQIATMAEVTAVLGTASAVLQIAGAAVTASTQLYEIASTIKNAPKEISRLNSDIKALNVLLANLKFALQSPDTRRLID
jgi:peptidoglycan hydrolase-like protein with peptidoglycan-binding domain